MVNKSSNINKGSDHFSTYLIVHKKKHDAENPGLEQAKYCGGLNR